MFAAQKAMIAKAVALAYSTWDPLNKGPSLDLSGGNLTAQGNNGGTSLVRGTLGRSTGKYYFESTIINVAGLPSVGVSKSSASLTTNVGGTSSCGYTSDGTLYAENNLQQTVSSYAYGNIIGVAVNLDTGTVSFYKNNILQGSVNWGGYGALGTVYPAFSTAGSYGGCTLNVGHTAFTYSPPSGYSAWG